MNIKIFKLKQGLLFIFVLFLFSLFGLKAYPGSSASYLAFDLSWLMLALSTLCLLQSYVLFYLQAMLFMGFWAKAMGFFVLNVNLVEYLGYWPLRGDSSAYWDRTFLVATVAACAILAVNLLHLLLRKNRDISSPVPQWYAKHHRLVWRALIFLGFLVNLINLFGQIYITGIRPQLILPFHLNIIVIWAMVIMIPLSMSTFLGWDRRLELKKQRFFWMCFFAFVTSLFALSRAIYLFWTLPFLFVVLGSPSFSFKNIFIKKNRRLILTFLIMALISIVSVTLVRTYIFNIQAQYQKERKDGSQWTDLKKLIVGRWVGLEATMATSAYPEAGWSLFKKGLLEKPGVGYTGLYNHQVLKPERFHNTANTMFSSLPGLVGILNYSASLLTVFFGTFFVCLLLWGAELLATFTLESRFYLSQQGFILGYWCVSGLNIPYLGMVNYFECLFALFCLYFINFTYHRMTVLRTKTRLPSAAKALKAS